MNIGGGFSINFNNGDVQQVDSFTLILDSITMRNIMANITSRLVAEISTLISSDRIGCVATNIIQDTRTLDYILRGNLNNFNIVIIIIRACKLAWPLLFSALLPPRTPT